MRRLLVAVILLSTSLALAGCSQDQQGTPSQQMSSWVKGTDFAGSTATIRSDLAKVTALFAGSPTSGQLHTVCGVLLVDVESANSNLPTPDAKVTSLLSSAYESLAAAAHACYDSPSDPSKVAVFSKAKASGTATLSEGELSIEATLGGAIPPGSTVPDATS